MPQGGENDDEYLEEDQVLEDDPIEICEVLEASSDDVSETPEDASDGYIKDLIPFKTAQEVIDFLERIATYKEQRWTDKMQRFISVNVLIAFNAVTIVGIWAFLVNGDARLLVGDTVIAVILGVLVEILKRKK